MKVEEIKQAKIPSKQIELNGLIAEGFEQRVVFSASALLPSMSLSVARHVEPISIPNLIAQPVFFFVLWKWLKIIQFIVSICHHGYELSKTLK